MVGIEFLVVTFLLILVALGAIVFFIAQFLGLPPIPPNIS